MGILLGQMTMLSRRIVSRSSTCNSRLVSTCLFSSYSTSSSIPVIGKHVQPFRVPSDGVGLGAAHVSWNRSIHRCRFEHALPSIQKWRRSFSYHRDHKEANTIYALSTAPGRAGIAVIRISGPHADACLVNLTSKELPLPRRATRRTLLDPKTKEALDDALVLRFETNQSYTGENLVELHCHGSTAVVASVLQALSKQEACRMAEPGEFTERAFDNNKIDLLQVEGIADLLNAETEAQRKQALYQMQGSMGAKLEEWQKEIVGCLAYVEAFIDFGDDEDDVTDEAFLVAVNKVQKLRDSIHGHLSDGRRGEILRSGIQVAIVGPPNAGKSSLLNVLAQRSAAIVSPHAGTTRDIIRVPLNIHGYPVIVCDTAGIHESTDVIEMEGVKRARECVAGADVIVVVIDGQTIHELNAEIVHLMDVATMIVVNKSDLVSGECKVPSNIDAAKLCWISCTQLTGIGSFIDDLGHRVTNILAATEPRDKSTFTSDEVMITRERHRVHLEKCVDALDAFLANPQHAELAAEDLRQAVNELGRILGRVDIEDVLDVLFSSFCIGK